MSGRNIPYQLRTNKAIERQIFLDLLHWLDRCLRFEHEFEYMGMGGPFMEDFRQLHFRFPSLQMTSIEMDGQVAKRQRFNKPHGAIQFRITTCGRFIQTYSFQKRAIVWLDYTSSGRLAEQLVEVGDLIFKLPPISVLKITLNAHPGAYVPGGDSEKKRTERVARLRTLCRHLPLEWLTPESVSESKFHEAIYRIAQDEIEKRLEHEENLVFHPVCAFHYADGQRMLTVMGLVGSLEEVQRVIRTSRLARWEFFSPGWRPPQEINVPELSQRERLFIQQLLPSLVRTGEEIRNRFRYLITDDVEGTEKLLGQYARFYRQFPNFERLL